MSRFVTNTTYPLIPNANEYMIENRVVSIHSEDRDITKYPNPASFEIELPEDYCNVSTVQLGTYTFPANYNTFSLEQANIAMSFMINKPFNPTENGFFDPLLNATYEALYAHIDKNYYITIQTGFYNPSQISNELENRFNEVVNEYVYSFIVEHHPELQDLYVKSGGYSQFVVVYNQVGQNLCFGNKSSGFVLTNDSELYLIRNEILNVQCVQKQLPEWVNWGLPAYLGFNRCSVVALPNATPGVYPRFYYGDAKKTGDNGYWLTPDANYRTQTVYSLEAPTKINLMGNSYFYMEVSGLNSIDETSPYNFSSFTNQTNETNGVHNSAFAKIAVTTTPVSQWYDSNSEAVTIFNPPAERIRRLKIKFRYHNGLQVDFGKFPFSFDLIFQILRPQNLRNFLNYNPNGQFLQGKSSILQKNQ